MVQTPEMYLLAYMETLTNHQYTGKLKGAKVVGGKFNTLWGTDYLLMDYNTFLGGIGEDQYDAIIDILLGIQA
jgi:hypothetical protein